VYRNVDFAISIVIDGYFCANPGLFFVLTSHWFFDEEETGLRIPAHEDVIALQFFYCVVTTSSTTFLGLFLLLCFSLLEENTNLIQKLIRRVQFEIEGMRPGKAVSDEHARVESVAVCDFGGVGEGSAVGTVPAETVCVIVHFVCTVAFAVVAFVVIGDTALTATVTTATTRGIESIDVENVRSRTNIGIVQNIHRSNGDIITIVR